MKIEYRMKFCTRCNNLYGFNFTADGATLTCNTCGNSEPFKPESKEDALILETNFRSGSSASGAASGITVNAYTPHDPTLPHVKTISCRNTACPSVANPEKRDVIYIKTDPIGMKFQYICNVCESEWTN